MRAREADYHADNVISDPKANTQSRGYSDCQLSHDDGVHVATVSSVCSELVSARMKRQKWNYRINNAGRSNSIEFAFIRQHLGARRSPRSTTRFATDNVGTAAETGHRTPHTLRDRAIVMRMSKSCVAICLSLALLGCSSDDKHDGPCTVRSGTYHFIYTERSGTCGPYTMPPIASDSQPTGPTTTTNRLHVGGGPLLRGQL